MYDEDDRDDRAPPYRVGYRRPPKEHQFQKGRSGNPKGRPKGVKNLATDIDEERRELLKISEGGKQRVITKQRAMVKCLVNKAVKGDTKAMALLVALLGRQQECEAGAPNAASTADDATIIELFVKSRGAKTDDGESNGG
jgi:hypothetical protein